MGCKDWVSMCRAGGQHNNHRGRAARRERGHDHALGLMALGELVDLQAVEPAAHFEHVLVLGDKLRVKSVL